MTVNSRNNLSPESQSWGREITAQAQSATQIAERALGLANDNARQLAGLAQAVGQLNVKVTPIKFVSASGDTRADISVPLDQEAGNVILSGTAIMSETPPAIGSTNNVQIAVSWSNGGTTFGISYEVKTLRTGDTGALQWAVSINGYIPSASIPADSIISITSTTQSLFPGTTVNSIRFDGSLIYVKEPI